MNKGFIFTMDAVLTLLPLFIAIASLSNMGGIDTTGSLHILVMGRRAQDILAVQEINGSLLDVSTIYQRGVNSSNQTLIDQATSLLSGMMNDTVPPYYGYNATMVTPFGNLTVSRGNSTDNLAVSVKSVVGPKLGWMGKALYKNVSVAFQNISVDVVRNVYNFDNHLDSDDNYGNANFYLPYNVTVNDCWIAAQTHNISVLPSDVNANLSESYELRPYINGDQATARPINGSEFKYVGYWGDGPFYVTNRDGDGTLWCNSSLIQSGSNTFTWSDTPDLWQNSMTLMVNYTTQILMPRFMEHQIIYLPDSGGYASTSICDPLPNDPNEYNSSSCNNTWASVVWSEKTFNIPSGTYIKDATLHLNIGGASDAAVVYLQNSSGEWTNIFNSVDYGGLASRTMPPTVLDLMEFISTGNNHIKVLLWDQADDAQAGYEYGIIKNSYIELLTTDQPLRLGVFNAENTNSTQQTFTFTVEADATKAYLYPGATISTTQIQLLLDNTTDFWPVYDNAPVPEYIDLSPYINATENYIQPGTYTVKVTITKFTRGGMNYNGVFSGTRVLVTYSQIFGYEWTEGYTESQETAEEAARRSLSDTLSAVGENISWNSPEIQASSSYVSAYPVTSYLALTIWEED